MVRRKGGWSMHDVHLARVALMVVVLVGCDGGGQSTPIAIGDFETAYVEAYCAKLVRCGVWEDEQTCLDVDFGHARSSYTVIPAATAAVDAGKATYDANAAGDCVAAFASSGCDYASDHDADACAKAFVGLAAIGAACANDQECSSGSCSIAYSGPSRCPSGVCVAPPTIGNSCSTGTYCGPNAYCDGTTCRARGQAGDRCDSGYGQCADDLDCVPDAGFMGPGRCRPEVADGESCVPGGGSSYPVSCVEIGDFCSSESKTCTRFRRLGESCSQNDIGCSSRSNSPMICGPQQKCILLPATGQPCTGGCSDASYCAPSGTCTPYAQNGASCNSSNDCESYFCDTSSGQGICAAITVCS